MKGHKMSSSSSSRTTIPRRPAPIFVLLFGLFVAIAFTFDVANARRDHDGDSPKRNRDHFDEILLRPDPYGFDDNSQNTHQVLQTLRHIYHEKIRPIEEHFQYADLRRHVMTDADINSKPIVLVVGPWSTGKSTLINYILGVEGKLERLYTGAEPTTADFTVLSYGDDYRTIEGLVLATDPTKPFSSMEKFGQTFLEHLLGIEIQAQLLRNVTFIDTPGILENRRQQERGYPYNDVMRWLVHRSDLIFVVFDPTKLDVGYELETLFKQLKGKESVIRIILNKADSINEQELMRVYGALFWSLSPLINVTEAPRVYVGSFWSEQYTDEELAEILHEEEKSLLNDMYEVIRNRIYNKIAFLRQHAIRVRIHALLVDSYVAAYRKNKRFFRLSDEQLAKEIANDPVKYNVYKTILSHPNISEYDLPEPDEYEEFFRINPLTEQKRIDEFRSYFAKRGDLEKLNDAISHDLPKLLQQFQFGEADSMRNWCKNKKKEGGMPCFSDIASDLWAMQKRYPNANIGRIYSQEVDEDEEEEEEEVEEQIKPHKIKRKIKKPIVEVVEEEDEEEEEEEIHRETYDSREHTEEEKEEEEPVIAVVPTKVQQPKVPKPDEGKIKKEKEQKIDRDVEESEPLTKPVKTVSTQEHHIVVDVPKPVEDVVKIRETDKKATVEPVTRKREESEQAKIKKPQENKVKETQSPPESAKSKSQTSDDIKKRDNVAPGKPKSDTKPTPDVQKSSPKVQKEDSVTRSPLPTVSAGHVKKPTTKLHPTVEELIDEDDKKSSDDDKPRCNKYRKNCDVRIPSVSILERITATFSAEPDKKTKCPPYRKSCQESSDDEEPKKEPKSQKTESKSHTATPVKVQKEAAKAPKETKPSKIQEPEEDENGQKCLPYRKTCRPVIREVPQEAKTAKEKGCPPYRKSCNLESSVKHDEKSKSKSEPKSKPKEEKVEPKAKAKEVKVEAKSKAKEEKVEPKQTKPTEKPASAKEKQKPAESAEKKPEPKKKETEQKSKPTKSEDVKKDEDEDEEKPVSAKYKYRKLRADLPPELKEKFMKKLAELEKTKMAVTEEEQKEPRCLMYRKSCTIEKPSKVEEKHTIEEIFEYLTETYESLFSFYDHVGFSFGTLSKRKSSKKCKPYRKSCVPSEEEEEEEIVPEKVKKPKCPPYRKSCSNVEDDDQEDEEEMKKPTKKIKKSEAKSSEEEDHHDVHHDNESDENGILPTHERQKFDSKENDDDDDDDETESEPVKEIKAKKHEKPAPKPKPAAAPAKEKPRRNGGVDAMTVDKVAEKSKESEEKVILSAKDKYRKKSAEVVDDKLKIKQGKEQMQQKSVEAKYIPDKVLTAKDKYRKQKTSSEEVSGEVRQGGESSGSKCNKYRKDCQSSSEQEEKSNVKTAHSSASANEKSVPQVNEHGQKCLPYRKTCVKIIRHEDEDSSTDHEEADHKKCLPYRKSCQNEQRQKEQTKLEEKIVKHGKYSSEESKPVKTVTTGTVGVQKCLPYRKTCTVIEDKHSKSDAHKSSKSSSSSSKDPSKPCLIYRKSCSDPASQAKKNLTQKEKDVIYIIDKETGKQKKMCRKKKSGETNGNGNVPNEEHLTSKIQNKFRKTAQIDTVIGA